MAAALTLLLIGSLLQGGLGRVFKAVMPRAITVQSGSCVTIPCSFDISDEHDKNFDHTCKALWRNSWGVVVFNSSDPQKYQNTMNGNFREKDCTVTLNNIDSSDQYHFKLECDNPLKYNFYGISITVTDDPPSPTVTPDTLTVKEGDSVKLTCSAPVPCPSHPPTLTWTSGLRNSVETLQENQDKTKVKTSNVTFTVSYSHHRQDIACTATYRNQYGGTRTATSSPRRVYVSYPPKQTRVSVQPSGPVPEGQTVTLTCNSTANPPVRNYTWYRTDGGQDTIIGTGAVLNIKAPKDPFFCEAENAVGAQQSDINHIDVQFAPQILPSSVCTKASAQLTCSCRTVGNPSPSLQWYLDELPINHSDRFVVSNGNLSSVITVNQPWEKEVSTLLCRSYNSLGSASQRIYIISIQDSVSESPVMFPVFVATVVLLVCALLVLVGALLVLVRALLLVNRCQKTDRELLKSQTTSDTSTVTMSQLLTSGASNEVRNAAEEDIYVHSKALKQDVLESAAVSDPNNTNLPSSGPNNVKEAGKSSEKGKEIIYTEVKWKKKKKEEDSVEMHQYDEGKQSEYAQVTFKEESAVKE